MSVIAVLSIGSSPAYAQADDDTPAPDTTDSAEEAQAFDDADLTRRRAETSEELDRISSQIALSEERAEALRAEVDRLRKDEETLRDELIATADAQRRISASIETIETRYGALREEEAGIQASLGERRGVLAEVLAGLQRIGRNPPPALLVSADDALSSVRSAILLGSIVPEMRAETERLVADLERLVTLRADIAGEREELVAARSDQAEEERRLALIMDEKRRLQAEREQDLLAERERAAELAEAAGSLEDLIGTLESEIESVRLAALQAEEATRLRERQSREELDRARERARDGTLDAERFSPAIAFDDQRGLLQMPVNGTLARGYGDDDGTGHPLQGIMVESRPGALVQAPADGWIVYAGPFRSYGQLLILNAGDDYHLVMAGMDRIDVSPGQFVVAGEPVATMGETRLAGAAALAMASQGPTLYIEFRKDGQPVDSDPWWAIETSGRANNDS